jgi:hypothetical protein
MMLLLVEHLLKLEVEEMLLKEWDLMVRLHTHEILARQQHTTMEEELVEVLTNLYLITTIDQ